MPTIKIEAIIRKSNNTNYRLPQKEMGDYKWPVPSALCCDGMRRAFGFDQDLRFHYESQVLELDTWIGKIGPKLSDNTAFIFCPYCGEKLVYEVTRTVKVVTKRVTTYREEHEEVEVK